MATIGRTTVEAEGCLLGGPDGAERPLPRYERDEILKALSNGP